MIIIKLLIRKQVLYMYSLLVRYGNDFLWEKVVLGKKYKVKIGKYNYMLHFPEYNMKSEEYKEPLGYNLLCPKGMDYIELDDSDRWGGKQLFRLKTIVKYFM